MAFSKSSLFDHNDQITSSYARVLAHPVRLDIIRKLAKNSPSTVENLTSSYPLSKSTISQHLEVLRTAGIINCDEKFPYTYYAIDLQNLNKLNSYFLSFFQTIL
jgi:DNA-binding transcriptional ArsR family regulator